MCVCEVGVCGGRAAVTEPRSDRVSAAAHMSVWCVKLIVKIDAFLFLVKAIVSRMNNCERPDSMTFSMPIYLLNYYCIN